VAGDGKVLCTDVVRQAALSMTGYRFTPSTVILGEGTPNPLASCALEWVTTDRAAPAENERVDDACDFAVLGPLVISRRDGPVSAGGHKEQTVLALLLAQANQVVSASGLIDGIWGERPPRTAAKTLQGYILRLRQALEPNRAKGADPELLVTTGAGYQLRAPPARLDAARFEQLVNKAARERAAGDSAGSASSLRTGLALWRGDPYSRYRDARPCLLEAERLTALCQAAIEDRIESDLAVGRAAEVVPELERLLQDNPFSERAWGQLIVALYRCGRQTEALRAYQRARSVLVEEMGIEPGPELRQLEPAVLVQDPGLNKPAGPAPRTRTGSLSHSRRSARASSGGAGWWRSSGPRGQARHGWRPKWPAEPSRKGASFATPAARKGIRPPGRYSDSCSPGQV
jgi:DNA-binding SARP family transcriptional activator